MHIMGKLGIPKNVYIPPIVLQPKGLMYIYKGQKFFNPSWVFFRGVRLYNLVSMVIVLTAKLTFVLNWVSVFLFSPTVQ